jgi:hypothetical protein
MRTSGRMPGRLRRARETVPWERQRVSAIWFWTVMLEIYRSMRINQDKFRKILEMEIKGEDCGKNDCFYGKYGSLMGVSRVSYAHIMAVTMQKHLFTVQ